MSAWRWFSPKCAHFGGSFGYAPYTGFVEISALGHRFCRDITGGIYLNAYLSGVYLILSVPDGTERGKDKGYETEKSPEKTEDFDSVPGAGV